MRRNVEVEVVWLLIKAGVELVCLGLDADRMVKKLTVLAWFETVNRSCPKLFSAAWNACQLAVSAT